jgi:hypothetical protein
MKTLITIAAVAAFAGTGYAQIMTTLPPSSTTEGVLVNTIGVNAGATHWDSASSLGSFKNVGTTEGTASINSSAYNPLGLVFASAIPSALQSSLNTVNAKGGIIRTIFLAESASWQDSLGYTYSGNFAGPQSYTALAKIENDPASGNPSTVQFGSYFDVNLAAGAETNFDFWFQGENATYGGDYTLLHPSNSSNYIAPGNALWSQQAVVANTWNATLGAYVDQTTYIVGLGDWRLDRGSDNDYSDTVLAMQFYTLSGAPFEPGAVPEPSTYGLIGAVSLLGLVALRRRMRKGEVTAQT